VLQKEEICNNIKSQRYWFTSDKKNLYFLVAVLLIPILYESMRFTPIEDAMSPHTFSPALTIWLQELFGTDGVIAYLASYYYVIPHIILLVGLGPLFFFAKKKPAWTYLSLALALFIIDNIIYFLYPVAPPIRLNEPPVVPIRIELFALSEKTISLHYSALPSGHIYSLMMGTLIGHLENWKKVKIIYGINVIIMTFVIIYLGDHYLIDAIASIVVVISIYYLINAFSEKYVSKKKETDPPLF